MEQKRLKIYFSSKEELALFEKCMKSNSGIFPSVKLIETQVMDDGYNIHRWVLLEYIHEIDLYYIGMTFSEYKAESL